MDIRRLVSELQVQKIELEMQNEELGQVHKETEAVLEKYIDLYDFSPLGNFILDPTGSICQVNLSGARLLGLNRASLVGARFSFVVAESDLPLFNKFLEKVFRTQELESCELALRQEPPPAFAPEVTAELPLPAGSFAGESGQRIVGIEAIAAKDRQTCRIAVVDISDLKKSEEQCKKSSSLDR